MHTYRQDLTSLMNSSIIEIATDLHQQIERWSDLYDHVIVMGDMNETCTTHDRSPPRAHHICTYMQWMNDHAGFYDVYRSLHPHHTTSPGYTHHTVGQHHRAIASRLDHIYVKGTILSDILSISIDSHPSLTTLSHHHMLHAQLSLPHVLHNIHKYKQQI